MIKPEPALAEQRMALLPLTEYKEILERLSSAQKLCTQAADALEKANALLFHAHGETIRSRKANSLITTLREATQCQTSGIPPATGR
jgi:hypothetical protein